jgi:phage anti-repressor protein
MNNIELIKPKEHNGRKAVSARDLHSYLENKKAFSDWIKHRIEKYGLIENIDYQTLSLNGEKGRPTIEYALTVDAAKELSMVEGNIKGKQARRYYIEIEKAYQSEQKTLTTAEQFLRSAQIAVELERKQKELDIRIDSIDHKLNGLLQIQASAEAELKALPVSTETLPQMGLRDKVRLLVNRYSNACNVMQQSVWDNIYQTLYYTYHVSVKSYTKRKDESWLDVADRTGHVDKMYIIVSNMLRKRGLSIN